MEAIEHFNTHMFNSLTGTKASEFDSLLRQVIKMIIRPIDPKFSRSDEEESLPTSRKEALLPYTTLSFSCTCYVGVVRVAWDMSSCRSSMGYRMWRYHRTYDTSQKRFFHGLEDDSMYFIQWPDFAERQGCVRLYMALKLYRIRRWN